MAKVTFTIADADDKEFGIQVLFEADPPMPPVGELTSAAQTLALHVIKFLAEGADTYRLVAEPGTEDERILSERKAEDKWNWKR